MVSNGPTIKSYDKNSSMLLLLIDFYLVRIRDPNKLVLKLNRHTNSLPCLIQ